MISLQQLPTPCLILDRGVVQRNLAGMRARAQALGVALRPHMKTAKSIDVARLLLEDREGVTVSTLKEAEYFFDHGFTDVLYAVGIAPAKLPRVAALQANGARLRVVLDSLAAAEALVRFTQQSEGTLSVLIEIDTDGHRAGVVPEDPALLGIARVLHEAPDVELAGVMTHAGGSYDCRSVAEITAYAEQERAGCVAAADALRTASIPCPIVSVGSTPTATFAEHLEGVTEMRPGNFVFYDLFQVGLGVCQRTDIGVYVLGTVIGHSRAHNRILTDAGGLALSKDLSTASQAADQRFGVVAQPDGADDLVVVAANQEHGVLTTRTGAPVDFDRHPVGSTLAILPVHSCMTAAAHEVYHVVDGSDDVVATWSRCNGW